MKIKNAKTPSPLQTSLLRVERAMGRIYCLIEITVFDNTVYCISIHEDEFSCELVGEDALEAQRLFEIVCDEGVVPYQLFDIVSDCKREKIMRISQN